MKYETIPYVDKPVSRILFGTAQPSFLRGEESNAILDAALEAGIRKSASEKRILHIYSIV